MLFVLKLEDGYTQPLITERLVVSALWAQNQQLHVFGSYYLQWKCKMINRELMKWKWLTLMDFHTSNIRLQFHCVLILHVRVGNHHTINPHVQTCSFQMTLASVLIDRHSCTSVDQTLMKWDNTGGICIKWMDALWLLHNVSCKSESGLNLLWLVKISIRKV